MLFYHNIKFCMTCLLGKTLGVWIIVAPTVGLTKAKNSPKSWPWTYVLCGWHTGIWSHKGTIQMVWDDRQDLKMCDWNAGMDVSEHAQNKPRKIRVHCLSSKTTYGYWFFHLHRWHILCTIQMCKKPWSSSRWTSSNGKAHFFCGQSMLSLD